MMDRDQDFLEMVLVIVCVFIVYGFYEGVIMWLM